MRLELLEELKRTPQWVTWRLELRAGSSKPTKVPYTPRLGCGKASVTRRETWGTFAEACSAPLTNAAPVAEDTPIGETGFNGIGFVFSADDPYCGIDFDNPAGDAEEFACQRRFYEKLNSYTEYSPSGTGIHIIVKGTTPRGRRRGHIEVYSRGRFFTITGNVLNPAPVREAQAELDELYQYVCGDSANVVVPPQDPTKDDVEILARARSAANGHKFGELWDCRWQQFGYVSRSEADFALFSMLAFYTKDEDQLFRLFRSSTLGQRSKAQRDDYLRYMLDKVRCDVPRGAALDHSHLLRPPPEKRWFTAAELGVLKFEPVREIIPGFIVQGLTILGGRPKLGKSWLLLNACVAVAEGGHGLGAQCPPGDVFYAALEDTQRRLQSRLFKLGAFPQRLTLATELPRADQGGVEQVREWLTRAPEPRLIGIDTLALARGLKGRDEQNYDADYRAMRPWKELADEFGVALVIIHHVRKLEAADPLEMISGTNGLTGAADAVLVLNRTSQGSVLVGRGRDLEEFEVALAFDPESCRWTVLGKAADVLRSDERNTIVRLLGDSSEPLSPKQIAARACMSDDAVRQMLLRMAAAGEVIKKARGLYTASCHNSHNDRSQNNVTVVTPL